MSLDFVFANFVVALRAARAHLAVVRASSVLTFASALFSFHVVREVVVPHSRAAGRTLHPLAFLVPDLQPVELCKHGPRVLLVERLQSCSALSKKWIRLVRHRLTLTVI